MDARTHVQHLFTLRESESFRHRSNTGEFMVRLLSSSSWVIKSDTLLMCRGFGIKKDGTSSVLERQSSIYVDSLPEPLRTELLNYRPLRDMRGVQTGAAAEGWDE